MLGHLRRLMEIQTVNQQVDKQVEIELLKIENAKLKLEVESLKYVLDKNQSLKSLAMKIVEAKETLYVIESIIEKLP